MPYRILRSRIALSSEALGEAIFEAIKVTVVDEERDRVLLPNGVRLRLEYLATQMKLRESVELETYTEFVISLYVCIFVFVHVHTHTR